MCLLSYYQPGVIPDADRLVMGACMNPDGHGWAIAIPEEQRILVGKSMNPDQAIADFTDARNMYPDTDAIFHSRIATSGYVSTLHCHPFAVNGDERTVLAHNGIIAKLSKDKHRSDTAVLAEDVIYPQYRRFGRAGVRKALEWYLGTANKVVILTVDPRYQENAYIINEGSGHWVSPDGEDSDPWSEGAEWHSNRSYEDWKPKSGYWKKGANGIWTFTAYPTPTVTVPITNGRLNCPYCGADESVGVWKYCDQCGQCTECGQSIHECTCWPNAFSTAKGKRTEKSHD